MEEIDHKKNNIKTVFYGENDMVLAKERHIASCENMHC